MYVFSLIDTARLHILDNLSKASKSSLLLEVNQFLDYVQNTFSEVLLPVDAVIKQGLLGKGDCKDIIQ